MEKKSFVIFENYSNSWVPMIDKDFINDSFIPEKPGQLLKEMKNDYVKGSLISEGIFNMVPSSKSDFPIKLRILFEKNPPYSNTI